FEIHSNYSSPQFCRHNARTSGSIWSRLRCSRNIGLQKITRMRRRPSSKVQLNRQVSFVVKPKVFAGPCAQLRTNTAERSRTQWSHWLIWHGRRRCYARKPDCSRCEVFKLCPSGKVFLRRGQAQKPDAN